MAAVMATTKEPAVVCILGTGSNCCYYDGKNIQTKSTNNQSNNKILLHDDNKITSMPFQLSKSQKHKTFLPNNNEE